MKNFAAENNQKCVFQIKRKFEFLAKKMCLKTVFNSSGVLVNFFYGRFCFHQSLSRIWEEKNPSLKLFMKYIL